MMPFTFPFEKEFFRFVEAGRFVNDVDVGCGVERTDQLPARRRAAVIDYRDGHVAQHFVFIGERIGRRVDENGAHGNQQYTASQKMLRYSLRSTEANSRNFF